MHSILWLDDNQITRHPIASQLYLDLVENGNRVFLFSSDENQICKPFDFSGVDDAIKKFPQRKEKRAIRVARILERPICRKFKSLRESLKKILRYLNQSDKKLTVLFSRMILRKIVYLKATVKLFRFKEEIDIVLFSRAYLIFMILIKYKLSSGKNTQILYYPFELYGHQTLTSSRLVRLMEKVFLKYKVDGLITQNDLRLEYYRRIGFEGKSLIARNYKRKKTLSSLSERTFSGEEVKLVHVGSVDEGRGIERILEMILKTQIKFTLTVYGDVRKNWMRKHYEVISRAQEAGRLYIQGSIAEIDLLYNLSDFDIGIISYDRSCLNHLYCAPSKLTDYLHSGVGVLSNSLPAMNYYSSKYDFVQTFNIEDPDSFQKAYKNLKNILATKGKIGLAQESSELCWENESKNIQEFIREVVAKKIE